MTKHPLAVSRNVWALILSMLFAGLLAILASSCGPTEPDQGAAASQELDTTGGVVRIDMGSRQSYVDADGGVWQADTFSSGAPNEGIVDRGDVQIAGTSEPRLYQTEHYCMSGLSFPLANGAYSVRLHFAETYWREAGRRDFDVAAEDQWLRGLDIFREAGGAFRALVKELDGVVVRDGRFNLTFRTRANCSALNALEVRRVSDDPSPAGIRMGVNIIARGNTYGTAQYTDAQLDALFEALKGSGFRAISVRVIWEVMEPSRGSYNDAAIAHLNRIFAKADQHGLTAMLDFHTLFNARDQGWQAPAWLSSFATQLNVNGEVVPARSLRQVFYAPAVRAAYADMMKAVVRAVGDHQSLRYISLLNEPYLNWEEGADNEPFFDATLRHLAQEVRTVTQKPVGLRFLSSWNPWCDEPRKQIGKTAWRELDFVGMNQYYVPPLDDALKKEGTTVWPMARRALQAVKGAGKDFLVTEIGTTDPSPQVRERIWKQLFEARFNTYKPDAVLIWNAQNDGDFFPTRADSYNVLSMPNTLSPYVGRGIAPYAR